MRDNPPRNTAIVWLIISIIGVVMIFVPGFVGIGGFEGGFAISFVSFFVAIIGLVIAVIYAWLAAILNRILRGDGLLVHWTYTPQEWKEYAEREYVEEKSEKKGLFIVVCGFALFFGFLFWVIDPESGFYVFLAMLGLIGIVAFAWQFSAWYYYRQNVKHLGEAYVARNGVYLNRQLYCWNFLTSRMEKAALENSRGSMVLSISFWAWTMTFGQSYTVRVPVPLGQEERAREIVTQLST